MTDLRQQASMLADNATDLGASLHGQHATSPSGALDFILVAAGAVIVLMVCVHTVKFLVRPRERDPNHIKRRVLRDDAQEAGHDR